MSVDSDVRVSAAAGLGAFALSVIIAAFSRISFGILVLRALILGVCFGGLAYGGILLMRRFLPELFDGSARPARDEEEGMTGNLVDIVLPGDAEPAAEATGRTYAAAGPKSAGGDAAAVGAGYAEAARSAAPGSLPGVAAVGVGADDDPAELEELEREVADIKSDGMPLGRDEGPAQDYPARPSVALDELDVLPDLEGLTDSFSVAPVPGQEDSDDGAGAPVPAGMDLAGQGRQDASNLAKAVRTLMRKDQKGP